MCMYYMICMQHREIHMYEYIFVQICMYIYIYVCVCMCMCRCDVFRYFNHLDACLLEIPSVGKIHLESESVITDTRGPASLPG